MSVITYIWYERSVREDGGIDFRCLFVLLGLEFSGNTTAQARLAFNTTLAPIFHCSRSSRATWSVTWEASVAPGNPVMNSPSSHYLGIRLRSLIWSCLDCDLIRSAIFFAERYYCVDPQNHQAIHLYANALFRGGHTHSALNVVNDMTCWGCVEVYSRCCNALGRFRDGQVALSKLMEGSTTATAALGEWGNGVYRCIRWGLEHPVQTLRPSRRPDSFLTLPYLLAVLEWWAWRAT